MKLTKERPRERVPPMRDEMTRGLEGNWSMVDWVEERDQLI